MTEQGVCAHKFDSMVCVAPAGHDGPHVTSNAQFPHGLQLPVSLGAPTPAMIELRAAAEEVVREMAYLFERDAQDDATLAANDIKDALAYRRLRAALTAPEGVIATHPDGRLQTMTDVLAGGSLTIARLAALLSDAIENHSTIEHGRLANAGYLAAWLLSRLAAPQT